MIIGEIKGDTRSLDYSSHNPRYPGIKGHWSLCVWDLRSTTQETFVVPKLPKQDQEHQDRFFRKAYGTLYYILQKRGLNL